MAAVRRLKQLTTSYFTTPISIFQGLFEKTNCINSNILSQNEVSITKDLLLGHKKLESDETKSLLLSTIVFIESTERFKSSQFQI